MISLALKSQIPSNATLPNDINLDPVATKEGIQRDYESDVPCPIWNRSPILTAPG